MMSEIPGVDEERYNRILDMLKEQGPIWKFVYNPITKKNNLVRLLAVGDKIYSM